MHLILTHIRRNGIIRSEKCKKDFNWLIDVIHKIKSPCFFALQVLFDDLNIIFISFILWMFKLDKWVPEA